MIIRIYLLTLVVTIALPPAMHGQEMPQNELLAWCIVPFDNENRTPHQRIEMLERLGINQYAYDWRSHHLPEMTAEWRLAQKRGIGISAVWIWIGQSQEEPESLSSENQAVLKKIADLGLRTQLWLGFHEAYFDGLDHTGALKKAQNLVRILATKIDTSIVKIALYNHGGWLGEPQNQVELISALPDLELGIVYNFHHAHQQLDVFSENLDLMMPHLWAVNLNGMRKAGPKILPIGAGDLEKEMISTIIEKGYTGPFGILGHVEDADVEVILQNNLKGYRKLWQQ